MFSKSSVSYFNVPGSMISNSKPVITIFLIVTFSQIFSVPSFLSSPLIINFLPLALYFDSLFPHYRSYRLNYQFNYFIYFIYPLCISFNSFTSCVSWVSTSIISCILFLSCCASFSRDLIVSTLVEYLCFCHYFFFPFILDFICIIIFASRVHCCLPLITYTKLG